MDLNNIENEIRRLHKLRMLQLKISDKIREEELHLINKLDDDERALAEQGKIPVEILMLLKTVNEREGKIKELLDKVDLIFDEYEELFSDDELLTDLESN